MKALLELLEPEEFVGKLWHRFTTRRRRPAFPDAASNLESARASLGLMFRGLGGPAGLAVSAAPRGSRFLARRDEQAIYLPASVDFWPDAADNRALHVWLAALLAHLPLRPPGPADVSRDIALLRDLHAATAATLADAPGLVTVHRRLCAAALATRPESRVTAAEAAVEQAVRILLGDGDPQAFDEACARALAAAGRKSRPFVPPPLWGEATAAAGGTRPAAGDEAPDGAPSAEGDGATHSARRESQEQTQRRDYLALNRYEKMLALSESLNLARPVEDDDEHGARHAAENSDEVVLSPHRKAPSTRLRLELDLAPAELLGEAAGEGVRYPEWDWRARVYRDDFCRVLTAPPTAAKGEWSPSSEAMRRIAKVQRQFEAWRPHRELARAQIEGDEIDLDAVVRSRADLMAGAESSDRIYASARQVNRNLAVALLVDASFSTDAWAEGRRVIDIERDAALVFCHALDAGGDAHAVYAFSSEGRHAVRVETVKSFVDPVSVAQDRLSAVRPGRYTRIGAAVRHVTAEIRRQPARERLIILITDGKPNDRDHYEGRFGVEDTRKAVQEARHAGVRLFGVAIDAQARRPFPMIFGRGGFIAINAPARLPAIMPMLMRHLLGG